MSEPTVAPRPPPPVPTPSRAGILACACAASLVAACGGASAAAKPTLVRPDGGERRIIYAQGRETPITLKVDPVTTGSEHFVMGTSEIAQGSRVPTHRHDMDELIFVHKGTPTVTLGDQKVAVEPGTTIFIPAGTWIGLENSAPEPVVFVWTFGHPEFERWVRDIAVPLGTPLVQKPEAEVRAINEKYHMTFK
jgi:quercetin dioxygenase-like cupin family protein